MTAQQPTTQHVCGRCKAAVHAGTCLCARCVKTFTHAVINVGIFYADLETLRTHSKGARYDIGGGKGGRKEQPVGMDLRFSKQQFEERDDGTRVLTEGQGTKVEQLARTIVITWAKRVLAAWPYLTAPADNVPATCGFIASVLTAVAGRPWAPTMLDDFLTAEKQLSRFVDRPADRWYAGKCSARTSADPDGAECTVDLYATNESGTLICPGCGTKHDVASRRDFLLKEASEYNVTATEAAAALLAWTDYDGSESKLVDLIRKWRDSNDLEVRDVTSLLGRDRHLYRLGDIQDRLVRHAQRKQAKRIGAA